MFRWAKLFDSPDFNPFAGQGRVEQLISGKYPGRIYFQGTSWPAKFAQSHAICCQPGEFVEVVGRQGLTLLVVPIIEDDIEPAELPQAMVI
ncbi:MAG: NfeD family protein [Thainema sp.]